MAQEIPIDQVLAMAKSGKKPGEIAKMYGTSPQKIGMVLSQNGLGASAAKGKAPAATVAATPVSLIDQTLSNPEKLAVGLAYLMAGGARVSVDLTIKVETGGEKIA